MDELDDDFKELCANLLSRVNKKRGDAEGERKVPNRTRNTATSSKLKKTKPAAKSQSQPGMMITWPECLDPHRQALTPKKEGGPLICGSEGTALEDGCGGHLSTIPLNTTAANCNQNSLADCVLNGSSQTTSSFPAAGEPEASISSPSKTLLVSGSRVRVTELVLERMQQFKRVAPEQLKHTSEKSLLEPVADEKVPDANQGKNELGNGVNPDLPAMEQDVALALTVQQEFKQEVPRSLEESGLFFCQICQKDLSAMNSTRREQHVNRCLDETEKSQVSSSNISCVPECPICGKQFQIPKSRASHLKHCAVKMQVPPQLLLQAVKLQASSLSERLPPAPSTQVSRSKRKGGSKEQAKKKPKMSKAATADEDVLVAMAMSRSLQEHEKQKQAESVTGGKLESALPIKWKPGSKKKSRKKLSLAPPPLLLQDPETSCKQIQDRVAMLLTEDVEFSCTPPLPFSRILEDEPEKTEWLLPLPKDKRCILWEFSALTGPCDPETFYAAGLTPPILPCKPVQNQKSETVFSLMESDQPQLIQQQPVISHSAPAELGNKLSDEPQTGRCEDSPSPSRKDVQILEDLIELAGEGLTLTQWNHDVHPSHTEEQSRKESAPTDIPLSGFVPPYTGKRCQRISYDRPLLQSLAFDFSGMVNNPHLSDIQFQVDSGEVLYAHMFVLYARCPQAVEMAHNEGFLVEEDGNLQICRVLLSEVTAEATYAFLRYLYSADSNIRPHVLSDVRILASRFGVSELIAVCRSSPGENQEPSEVDSGEELFSVGDDEDCENRAENFQELLKSMWRDEDEEEIALLKPEGEEEEDHEKVDEQELEEIYEFAATQRKMAQDKPQEEEYTEKSIYSESEKAQDMNQQVDDKKRKVFESPSACSKIKEWKGNINLGRSRCDLRTQEKKIQGPDRCEGINVTQITTVHCQDESYKCSDNAMSCSSFSGERQTTRTPRVSRSYQASQDEEEEDPWEKLFPSHQHNVVALDVSYEHMFSATQSDYCDPASLNENIKDPGETNSEKCVEINNSPVCHQSQKSLESGKSNFCHSPLTKLCTPLFPLSAKLNQTLSRVYKGIHPISTPIRDLSLYDVPFYKASDQGFVSRHENIKRRVFPDRSPCIHLNKKKSLSPSSSQILKTRDATSHTNKEPDIIVLSDSDEEIELKQAKEESDSGSSLREIEISRKLDYICKKVEQDPKVPKSEPVSVVDKEVHQRLSQVSLGIQNEVHSNAAAEVLPEMHVNSWAGTCVDSKLNLNLSCGKEYSCEESSSVDASWLVPGTPFLSKSRNCSTQTQVSSMRNLNCQGSTHKTEVLVVGNNSHKPSRTIINSPEPTSGGLPVILSQKPFHLDNSVSKRNSFGSQLGQCSKDFLSISPVPTSPLSPNCASVKEKSSESPSSARQVPPCYKQSLANKTDISVVEVQDSEEEKDATPFSPSSNVLLGDDPPVPVDDAFWDIEYLSPIRETSKEPEKSDCANNSTTNSKSDPKEEQWKTPTRPLEVRGSTPLRGSPLHTQKHLSCDKKSPVETLPSMGNRLSFLDSKVWDSWNGDEDDLPEVIPLTQRLSAADVAQNTELLKTPHPICPKKNLPPKVPITPMPEYSIMETPELKKELNRFGVRPLPKHRMVLKLKEIFQYTHQVMESDSEDEFSSSQPPLWKATAKHCSPSKADGKAVRTKSSKASSGASKQKMSILVPSLPVLGSSDDNLMGPSTTSCAAAKMSAETKSHAGDASRQNKVTLSLAGSPVKGSLAISTDEQMLSASQESAVSSGDGTDHSFGSQSSSANEFETCALALEEDYNEGVPASQTATQDAEKQEAVRRYIHSNPALYRRILFYEPLELAELQAELKQNGIKIGMGKLLDFLDAHCITFTTAGARKEKQQHRGKKKRGKRY